VPKGIVFELRADRRPIPLEPLRLQLRGLFDGTVPAAPGDVLSAKVRPVYLAMLLNRGAYLAAQGDHEAALAVYADVLRWSPSEPRARELQARSRGALEKALRGAT
jgi:hypothetical protein